MVDTTLADERPLESFPIPGTDLSPSRIGLGTWAIGGWMWGGTDEAESIRTIHAALDRGITLIDTAPVYGFGRSEEIVGKALADGGRRDRVRARDQSRARLEGRKAVPQRPARPHHEGDRGFRCAGCAPTRSISIKCIGRIRIRRSKKPRARWPIC